MAMCTGRLAHVDRSRRPARRAVSCNDREKNKNSEHTCREERTNDKMGKKSKRVEEEAEEPEEEEVEVDDDEEGDSEGEAGDEDEDGGASDSEVDEDELEMEKAALLHKAQAKVPKINKEADLMEKLGDVVLGGGKKVPWAELFYVSSRVPAESIIEDADDDLKREVRSMAAERGRETYCSRLPPARR